MKYTTARRAYYVRYPRDFSNEYDLRYTVGGADDGRRQNRN